MTTPPKDVPTGRLGRLARLAGLGLRASTSKLRGADPSDAVREAAEVLGTLRGLAAKVGQMASYVDGFMPTDNGELYGSVMGKLCAATASSSPAAVQAILEEELSAPIHELFASWEPEPFASASLGQVHRATLLDGRAVAVKVQHPGIDQALESDVRNISTVEGLFRPLAGQRLDTKAIVSVLCARLREELDYLLEAKRQEYFAALHQGDPMICVPKVIAARSSRRVLTSELVRGKPLEQAAGEEKDVRRKYAETMWRFVFRGNFVGRMFNTDPHPGNYIFLDDGRVAFLDFGSIQPLTDHMFEHGLAQYVSALKRDEEGFVRATAAFYRTHQAPLNEHTRHCFEPVFSSPFRITRDYAARLLQESGALPKKMVGKSEAPSELPLFNRLQFGFYSVLARLDVDADYAAASRAVLAERAQVKDAGPTMVA